MNGRERPVVVPGHTLEQVVGRGATSVVWAGKDAAGRPVAIKIPHEGIDAVGLAQSAAERQVLTAVRHEHLVSLRAIVPLPDQRVATVFDLVEGASLRSTVDARGHLRAGETVTVVLPVCDAVAALHRAGAIHGDISPGNILITTGGRPLLADLGGSRVAGTGAVVVGTPGFVAPEVLRGEAPGIASDVYSLGAVAWYCLTGSPPPQSPLRMGLEEVISLLGPQLAPVVADSIDPEPSRRPAARRLAEALYAATPPEPIEVVVGADDASALTHRLRLNAVSVPEAAPVVGRSWRRAVGAASAWAAGWASAVLRRRRSSMGVVAVAALLAGAALWAGGTLRGAPAGVAPGEPTRGPDQTAATALASAVREVATSRAQPSGIDRTASAEGASDIIDDPTAPQRDPESLLRALGERRATLLVSRDARGLAGVDHHGSASWQADARLVAALERNGQRYAGLGVAQVQARTLSFAGDRAVVRARVGLTAYQLIDSAGHAEPRAADPGQDLDITLVRTPQGWRIESISAPTAT